MGNLIYKWKEDKSLLLESQHHHSRAKPGGTRSSKRSLLNNSKESTSSFSSTHSTSLSCAQLRFANSPTKLPNSRLSIAKLSLAPSTFTSPIKSGLRKTERRVVSEK